MKAFAIAAIAATALTLTGCGENLGKGQPLNVVSGHIVMGATDDRPAVGYFRIEGGPQPVQLVAVTADLAQRVEMHESVRENGLTTAETMLNANSKATGTEAFESTWPD